MQTEDRADSGRGQSTNKYNLDADFTYEQQTCETKNLALTPSKDSDNLSQHTKSTNFFDQNYTILDISPNTPQYWNDVFCATDASHNNIIKKSLSLTNKKQLFAQTNMHSNSSLLIQMESILFVQENESLIEQPNSGCTDNYAEFSNQSIDNLVIENDFYFKGLFLSFFAHLQK